VTITTSNDAAARQAREEQEALGAVMAQMGAVNATLRVLHGELSDLKMLTLALDALVANVDELGQLYEAPAATRSALDASSAVATLIDDLAGTALRSSSIALGLHGPGMQGLAATARVKEESYAMAFPR
jgi:hypothetical protein